MLNDEQIAQVRERVDLVEVVGRVVKLRQSGQNFMGCCPFHPDKTPSFSVSRDKQLFYCFGCRARGNVFTFVMQHEHVSFTEAVLQLAQSCGVILQTSDQHAERQQALEAMQRLHGCINAAHHYFRAQLQSPANGGEALAYLKRRRIHPACIERFALGYAGAGQAFVAAMHALGFDTSLLYAAGLLTEQHQALFEHRLIFPISNLRGQVCGFGGRCLRPSRTAKYLNSRQSEVFNKSEHLYHFHAIQKHLRHQARLVVVEGYMDVIALTQLGVPAVVATCGTRFSEHHAKLCQRWAQDVVVFFDGDAAGQRGALATCRQLMQLGVSTRVLAPPEGEDPDSWRFKIGRKALLEQLEQAPDALEYFIEQHLAQMPHKSAAAMAHTLRQISPLIADSRLPLERELALHRLSEKLQVPNATLQRWLATAASSEPIAKSPAARRVLSDGNDMAVVASPSASSTKLSEQEIWELKMLQELWMYPELANQWPSLADYAQSEVTKALLCCNFDDDLAAQIKQLVPNPHWQQQLLRSLPKLDPIVAGTPERRAIRTLNEIKRRLERRRIQCQLEQVVEKIKQQDGNHSSSDVDINALLQQKRHLSEKKRLLLMAEVS